MRGELIKIPEPVKAVFSKTKQTNRQRLDRAIRAKAHERLFVHVLGRRPRPGEGGRISLAHFHPLVLSSIGYKPGDKFPWKSEVPLHVVRELDAAGFAYDAANRVERLDVDSPPLVHKPYVVVPNVPIMHDMHEVWEQVADVRRLHDMAGSRPAPSLSARSPAIRPTKEERDWAASVGKSVETLVAYERENQRQKAEILKRLQDSERDNASPRRQLSQGVQVSGGKDGYVHFGGVCRHSLCSPDWHAKNPDAAKEFFGFDTWDETQYHMWAFWPDLQAPDRREGRPYDPGSKHTPFERALVTKMRMHRSFTRKCLAMMWGVSTTSIARYVKEWAPMWGEVGEMLSILEVSEDYLEQSLPRNFRGSGLERVMGLADGKDYMCETDRAHTAVSRAMRSNKVHASALRCITWSTPSGLTFEHTDLFFGRVSEKRLVQLWGDRFKNCPSGWDMLVDRGFAGTAHHYPKYHAQLSPAFVDKRKHIDVEELQSDYQLCRRRYSCEVVYSRINTTACLRDIILYEYFPFIQHAHHWGHGAANLMGPLQVT